MQALIRPELFLGQRCRNLFSEFISWSAVALLASKAQIWLQEGFVLLEKLPMISKVTPKHT